MNDCLAVEETIIMSLKDLEVVKIIRPWVSHPRLYPEMVLGIGVSGGFPPRKPERFAAGVLTRRVAPLE